MRTGYLAAFVTCAAATLSSGCFDTGSHSVIVSSFAARGCAPGARVVEEGARALDDPAHRGVPLARAARG